MFRRLWTLYSIFGTEFLDFLLNPFAMYSNPGQRPLKNIFWRNKELRSFPISVRFWLVVWTCTYYLHSLCTSSFSHEWTRAFIWILLLDVGSRATFTFVITFHVKWMLRCFPFFYCYSLLDLKVNVPVLCDSSRTFYITAKGLYDYGMRV